MRIRRHKAPALTTLSLAVLMLAGCGANNPAEPEGQSEQNAGSSSEDGGKSGSFIVASVSTGMPDLPLLAALDDLREMGYEPEYVALNQGAEIAAQGVSSGEFQLASGADNTFSLAIQAGADMRMIMFREDVIWGMYAREGIEECSDLDGARVAIHAPSSSSTAMVYAYIQENCPGAEPETIVIEGSENRYAALLAGQIDASALELQDAVKLPQEPNGDEIHQVSDFAEDIPGLQVFSQYVDREWAEENPEIVKDFIKALLLQHREIDGNPEYLEELWNRYADQFGDLDTGTEEAFEAYSTVFPVDGGMDPQVIEFSRDFFGEVGPKIDLSVEEMTDDSYLKEVLEDIGEAG